MNDIFVREDIAKPENRVNLALFHLQMDDKFHNLVYQQQLSFIQQKTYLVIAPIL